MRTSFHHQPEAQHPIFQLSTSWQADYPIFRGVKPTSHSHDAASAFDLPDGRSFEGRNRMDDLLACQSVSAYPERKSASAKQGVTRDGDDPNASAVDRGPCRRGRCGTA